MAKDAIIAHAVREEKPVMRKKEGIYCQMKAETKLRMPFI